MMLFDRTIIPLLVGPYISWLLINGSITQACEADVYRSWEIGIGALVLLGSLGISALHHKEIKKIEASTEISEEAVRQGRLNALAGVVKSAAASFMYKKPPVEPPLAP